MNQAIAILGEDIDPVALRRINEELATIGQSTSDLAESFNGLLRDSVNSWVDDLVEGTLSGKKAIEELLKDIAKMLIASQINNLIGALFGGGAGGGGGGIGGSIVGGLLPRAAPAFGGSTAAVATAGLFSSSGPAIAGGFSGRTTPASSSGKSTVNIFNQSGAQVAVDERQTADGRVLDVYIDQRVEAAMGSGRLDKTFRANYGLARRGSGR